MLGAVTGAVRPDRIVGGLREARPGSVPPRTYYLFICVAGAVRPDRIVGGLREARPGSVPPRTYYLFICVAGAVRPDRIVGGLREARPGRSEEHTSELQSHSDLVCRLLLEKKNIFKNTPRSTYWTTSS